MKAASRPPAAYTQFALLSLQTQKLTSSFLVLLLIADVVLVVKWWLPRPSSIFEDDSTDVIMRTSVAALAGVTLWCCS